MHNYICIELYACTGKLYNKFNSFWKMGHIKLTFVNKHHLVMLVFVTHLQRANIISAQI